MEKELASLVSEIIEKETGPLAKFIVKKQCSKLGKAPEDLTTEDLPKLAELLADAMSNFDPSVADRIYKDVMKAIQSSA